MSSYMMKVTDRTVELEDGTRANVALYAYKPYYRAEYDQHQRSGARRADEKASEGKFTGRVVIGHVEDNGAITVDAEQNVYETKRGSFYDDLLCEQRMWPAKIKVQNTRGKLVLARYRSEEHPDGYNIAVEERYVSGRWMRIHKGEAA